MSAHVPGCPFRRLAGGPCCGPNAGRLHHFAGFVIPVLTLLALISALSPAPALAGTDGVADLLRQGGIQPVDPPTAASDFSLPTLGGGEMALSDARGRWALLTFFATWCGPCRAEMPTLETLHRDQGERLSVLAVSVDEDSAPVGPFVRGLGVSFPILLDRSGQIGSRYRASSIPLTYVIDPRGRIVGLSRGSRDWSALGGLLDRLRELVPGEGGVPTEIAAKGSPGPGAAGAAGGPAAAPPTAGTGAIDLPSALTPPTATVELTAGVHGDRPEAGETFDLAVAIRWAGNFDQYLLHPPQVALPDGVTRERVTAETSSEGGRTLVTYHLALRAAAPGRYALDPVELRYTPRGENEPVATRVAGPTVEVVPATVAGLTPRALAWTGGGLAAAAALAGAALLLRRRAAARRAGRGAADSAEERHRELTERFAAARRLRMEGDAAGFLAALAKIEDEIDAELARQAESGSSGSAAPVAADAILAAPAAVSAAAPPTDTERAAFTRALEAARYGGRRLAAADLDPHERRVERRLAALRPDPDRHERQRIAFKEALPASRIHEPIEEGR